MEELKLHCHGCGGSFARDELQYRPSGGVLIGETFISARYAMRKKSRKSPSPLLLPRFVKPCRPVLGIWPTSAGR